MHWLKSVHSSIRSAIHSRWSDLPPDLRLEGDLRLCHRTPLERDLLASVRLQHLHVAFLLEIVLAGRLSYPPVGLIEASARLLRLTVQVGLLKEHLGNSGTDMTW